MWRVIIFCIYWHKTQIHKDTPESDPWILCQKIRESNWKFSDNPEA